jgi:hypothetical protein
MFSNFYEKMRETYKNEMRNHEYRSCLDLITIINNNLSCIDFNSKNNKNKYSVDLDNEKYIGNNRFHRLYNEVMDVSYNTSCNELSSFIDMVNKISDTKVELSNNVIEIKRANKMKYDKEKRKIVYDYQDIEVNNLFN